MDTAFKWIETNGIPSETAYPYTARDGECKQFTSEYKNVSFVDVPNDDPA